VSVSLGGRRELADDVEFGVEAHIGVCDNPFCLAEHWRADEDHRCSYACAMHRYDVFNTGVAERGHAGPEQRSGDLG
jgi:hypothetical protein